MREPWIVTSRDETVRERVLAENVNEAHKETERNLLRQGRPVPPIADMRAEAERREPGPDYDR